VKSAVKSVLESREMGQDKRKTRQKAGGSAGSVDSTLRIIGGSHRGRKLQYHGDQRTRPMKDRVREAIFNLLGPEAKGKHAIDLFAGTGALALECISRGAKSATAIERHFPTARLVEQNAREIGLEEVVDVTASDTFFWLENDFQPDSLPKLPWVVFCSPPYDFYIERCEELMNMLTNLLAVAPPDSIFIVESDQRFDTEILPHPDHWICRDYSPARVAILRIAELANPTAADTDPNSTENSNDDGEAPN